MNINELASHISEKRNEMLTQLSEWIYKVDNHLTEQYSHDDIHCDVWNTPTWNLDGEECTWYFTNDGVSYTFNYRDAYDEICDTYIDLYIYDKWLDMSIEDVCKDIVRMSDEMYEQDRQQELAELKRQIKSADVSKEMLADMF